MRYAILILVFWPLVCCEKCDYTPVCIFLSTGMAIIMYIVISISHELRSLAAWSQGRRRPH